MDSNKTWNRSIEAVLKFFSSLYLNKDETFFEQISTSILF